MKGPPAALYPAARTNATAIKAVDCEEIQTFVFLNGASPQTIPNVPLPGASYNNRLGNRTRGISMHIVGQILPTGTNAAQSQQALARIIVFYDRQNNTSTCSQSDLINDTNNGGTTLTSAFAGINMANRDRFVILRDRKIVLPPIGINGATSTVGPMCIADVTGHHKNGGFLFNEFIKLRGLETLYNTAVAGTQADISAGSYGILCIANEPSGFGSWQLEYQARYKFLD